MSLPERQQEVLDQIEQSIHQSDPGLRSMFAGFAKLASPSAMPVTGASTAGERW